MRALIGLGCTLLAAACAAGASDGGPGPGEPTSHDDDGWQRQDSGTRLWFTDVAVTDEQHGCAIGTEGIILCTADAGLSWTFQRYEEGRLLRAIELADAERGWIIGNAPTIFRTDDGGATWIAQNDGGNEDLLDLSVVDAHTALAAGYGAGEVEGLVGKLLRTDDGGTTWIAQYVPAVDMVTLVDFPDGDHGWIAGRELGAEAWLLRTDDRGATWRPQGPLFGQDDLLVDLEAIDATTAWLLVRDADLPGADRAFVTRDGGATWDPVAAISGLALTHVEFVDDDHGWVVGTDSTIVATSDGGRTWTPQAVDVVETSGEPVPERPGLTSVSFTTPDHGWAVGYGGLIVHTSTGGW